MKKIAIYIIVAAALQMAACNKDGRVTGVSIEPREVLLSLGERMVLTATVSPDNATEQTVYWISSDPDRVAVDDNGRITLIREWDGDNWMRWLEEGTWYDLPFENIWAAWSEFIRGQRYVSIYAMTKESLYGDECRVWFIPGGSTLEVSETNLTMEVGEKHTLSAHIYELTPSNLSITWSSNAPHIATVDPITGEVTAVASGTATITATTQDGNRRASCRVSVISEILLKEDFEKGFGTLLAGWTFVNDGNYTNRWHVGTATASSGSRSCYISNNNSGNRYSTNSVSEVHFFRDLNIVSTAENPVIISFYWKFENPQYRRDSRLEVSIVGAEGLMGVPVILVPSGYIWQRNEVTLPAMSGTIQVRFSWYNENNYMSYAPLNEPGAAIDNIVIYRR